MNKILSLGTGIRQPIVSYGTDLVVGFKNKDNNMDQNEGVGKGALPLTGVGKGALPLTGVGKGALPLTGVGKGVCHLQELVRGSL